MSILEAYPIYAGAGGVLLAWLVLCWLTRKIDLDALQRALDYVNAFFVYEGESGLERWRVLKPSDNKGDCEDHVLTVIDALPGWFLWRVSNPFSFRLWRVKDPRGNAHMIAVCKHGAFDNHKKRLTPVAQYKAEGYRFVFPWPFPLIWVKLAIGKIG